MHMCWVTLCRATRTQFKEACRARRAQHDPVATSEAGTVPDVMGGDSGAETMEAAERTDPVSRLACRADGTKKTGAVAGDDPT